MHGFAPCDCKDHEADIHFDDDFNYAHFDSAYDSTTIRELDSLICCPKCHSHSAHNIMNSKCGSGGPGLGTAAAAAAAALLPGTKKLSTFNYLHCHGNCYNHKHPNHRVNHHQVKMRLKEKSKKKLEEKASACLLSTTSSNNMFVQETITTTTSFSKIDQMAAVAAAAVQSETSLTMELFGTPLNLNTGGNNDLNHHIHLHHQQHIANINNSSNQSSTTTNNQSGSAIPSSTTNTTTSTTASVSASPSQTIQIGINTNGKQATSQQQRKSKSSSNNQNQEECCTKKDDCRCAACIQRQKIAEELIAEEESSKKKKQKKKKSKSKQNKISNNNSEEKSTKDVPELEKIEEAETTKSEVSKSTNESTTNETVESSTPITINSQQSSLSNNMSNNKIISKKNKKNKQQPQSSNEPEILGASPPVTLTSTEDNTTIINTTVKKLTNKEITTTTSNNNDNSDSSSADIQQWIKVKNKNKQNQNISNSTNSSVNNIITTSNLIDNWTNAGLDIYDDTEGLHNDDAFGDFDENDPNSNDGFKMIQNDRRRMSNYNNNDNEHNGINDSGFLNSRMASINPIGMAPKAKLLAIEAQIAFNNNELKGAVQYISEALELDPRNPIYYINRAYYHERLNEFEHALKDTDSALRYDESKDHFDHALCLKAKALIGLEQYEPAEALLIKLRSLPHKPKTIPLLEKELLLVRIKKLISANYTLPLARLYSFKFPTISDALSTIEQNCNLLIEKKLSEFDPKLHMMLIHQQQQKNPLSDNFCWLDDQDQMQLFENEAKQFIVINRTDYDDEEIYFSDEEEHDICYSHPDNWHRPKDVLKKSQVNFEDTKEPPNSKGQKALWIGNVSPTCSLPFVTGLFMKFGNVTFCKIFSNEQRTTSDVAYLLLHYDNDISPRLVMSYFKDKVVPGISKDDNCPLLIRFRNKNDKIDETNGEIGSTCGSNGSPLSGGQCNSGGSNSPSSKTISECYYWRTTGCDRQHCTFRHVVGNRGVDKQAWMRKKN